jgi:hypothetical protein
MRANVALKNRSFSEWGRDLLRKINFVCGAHTNFSVEAVASVHEKKKEASYPI